MSAPCGGFLFVLHYHQVLLNLHRQAKARGRLYLPPVASRFYGYFLHHYLAVFDNYYNFYLHNFIKLACSFLLSRASVSLCDHSSIALQIYKIHLKVQIIFQVFSRREDTFFLSFHAKKMKGRKRIFSPPPSFFCTFRF